MHKVFNLNCKLLKLLCTKNIEICLLMLSAFSKLSLATFNVDQHLCAVGKTGGFDSVRCQISLNFH